MAGIEELNNWRPRCAAWVMRFWARSVNRGWVGAEVDTDLLLDHMGLYHGWAVRNYDTAMTAYQCLWKALGDGEAEDVRYNSWRVILGCEGVLDDRRMRWIETRHR